METIGIEPVLRPIQGTIRPPGSKSLTNRVLIVAALAQGRTELTGVLDCVDTRVMIDNLKRLGFAIEFQPAADTAVIDGAGGNLPASSADLWCENSGTSIRFLTALCAAGRGRFRLDDNARMRERPIGALVEALAGAGVNVRCEGGNGCPPVIVDTDGLPGAVVPIDGGLSSQYLSGLLMAAPAARGDVTLRVRGELVSRPYIDMTLAIMSEFGAGIREVRRNEFLVNASPYRGRRLDIEPDASAASYFFAAAAITRGEVRVDGLGRDALQGDVRFVDALASMGCEGIWNQNSITVRGAELRGIDIDMNEISDTAPTLACVAAFASGPTRIRNVAHMRIKETDRVHAVVTELKRAGLRVEEHEDGLTIHPGPLQPATIQTYDDHRMAMSFSLLGLRAPGIRIAHPDCTAKTYPRFFADLEALCRTAR